VQLVCAAAPVLDNCKPYCALYSIHYTVFFASALYVLQAHGFWFVEQTPELRPGYSRIWMVASLTVNNFVPGFIVDYAARRALPRASTWLRPTCESAQRARTARDKAAAASAAAAAGSGKRGSNSSSSSSSDSSSSGGR
jgi:hypothetical protein